MDERELFLTEMLREDGLRGCEEICSGCVADSEGPATRGTNRCSDCSGDELLCDMCCVERHVRLPFHVVEVRPAVSRDGATADMSSRHGTESISSALRCSRWDSWCSSDIRSELPASTPSTVLATSW